MHLQLLRNTRVELYGKCKSRGVCQGQNMQSKELDSIKEGKMGKLYSCDEITSPKLFSFAECV